MVQRKPVSQPQELFGDVSRSHISCLEGQGRDVLLVRDPTDASEPLVESPGTETEAEECDLARAGRAPRRHVLRAGVTQKAHGADDVHRRSKFALILNPGAFPGRCGEW